MREPPVLGGSTLPAAAGLDPYRSPIRLWLELTGRIEREETEAMWWGKREQPLVFERLNLLGWAAYENDAPLFGDGPPWLIGHADGWYYLDGKPAGPVEAKVSALRHDEPPAHWQAQLQTYIHLAGAEAGLLAIRGGLTLTVYELPRDQRSIDLLLGLGERFVEQVRTRTLPAPLGHPDDRAALQAAWPTHEPLRRVRETRQVREARRELRALREAEKARTARMEHLRATITAHMGDAAELLDDADNVVAYWRASEYHRLDTDQLRRDAPVLADNYTKTTIERRLRL